MRYPTVTVKVTSDGARHASWAGGGSISYRCADVDAGTHALVRVPEGPKVRMVVVVSDENGEWPANALETVDAALDEFDLPPLYAHEAAAVLDALAGGD
ncbi:MAG: hypothetical protein Q8Q52_05420 [Acidimicrobiia bacterium]|nr:hypothetical protein [Acidimicrobiia bacterium]